jgi:hypothetical protein
MDAVVTKQGDIITDIPVMMTHAQTKNIMWGAQGDRDELLSKAQAVSDAIRNSLNNQRLPIENNQEIE